MRLLPNVIAVIACLLLAEFSATAATFSYVNVTDQAGGPGQGAMPTINRWGDVAFMKDNDIYVHRRQGSSFINLMNLAGAPTDGWHPRLTDSGDVAFIDPNDKHVWLFDAATNSFSDLATRPNFPGISHLFNLYGAFDMNNGGKLALHSGDNNFGDIFVYDPADSSFSKITDLPGTSNRGRDCRINNADQVAYSGGADIFIYSLSDGTSRNITDLPGGPGSAFTGALLNDAGDIAISSGSELMRFTAADESFWYLSTLPDYPASIGSVDRNSLGTSGAISFWADEIYYFDPGDSTFTQLTNQGIVPFPGHESKMNDNHFIAFEAGGDIWLADLAAAAVETPAYMGSLLAQNQPNPFNPMTRINYEVPPGGALIQLEVLDLRGHRLRTLVTEHQAEGGRTAVWDGRDSGGRAVASGTYLYRLKAGQRVEVRGMQLVR